MKVRDEFLAQVRRLSNFTDISDGETKTLAVIAFYQPIKQSEIVKIRGNRAYEQVKNLIGAGLIVAEPKGVTKLLSTTERFADYFGAPIESLRGKLDPRDKAIIDGDVNAARDAPDRPKTEKVEEEGEKEDEDENEELP
jgi:segregation and condensation protein B